MTSGIQIRRAASRDAGAVARLSEQLGYPVTVDEVRQRLQDVASRSDHACLVATATEIVIGWVHVFESLHVESARCAEIGGLVVDEAQRGRAVGAALLAAAEAWAVQRGLARVRVRSNVIRSDAHRFYVRNGYAVLKHSAVFTKDLED